MRVLYVCPDLGIPLLGRKGASIHVRGLAEAFRRGGDEVAVVSPLLNKSPWEPPARFDVPVKHVPPSPATVDAVLAVKAFVETIGVSESPLPGEVRRILWNEHAAVEVKRRFDNHRPDFIYERSSLYGTLGARVAGELEVPLLAEVNAPIAAEQAKYRGSALGDLGQAAERWALGRADAVFCVSQALRAHVLELGIAAERVHVLPNAVDTTLFRPEQRSDGRQARWERDGGPVVGFVGGLRPWHGTGTLPRLLARLATRHPNVRLVVVGDGPAREELQLEIERHGLGENAVLTGSLPHDDVPGLIRQFDVAIAPYDQLEHDFYFSPLKVFEYMACGKPVVAARVGQLPEVIEHGMTGLTYEPGDDEALAAACEQLLADDALRQRLGSAAARAIAERHTWERNASRVREVAEAVIASRRPRE